MKIARYWEKETASKANARGHVMQATGWGWSETAADEARQRAKETAQRVLSFLIQGEFIDAPHEYGYDERPPREEIIDEFTDHADETNAIVTRNSYGCLVLNTRDLVFIDIDFPNRRPPIPMPAFLRKLLGKTEPASIEQTVLGKVRDAAGQYAQYGFRIYRTKNGFRVMVHTHSIPSQAPQATALLDAFDADPLYRRLCKNQECFRARLTPKPFRCGSPNPPYRFPFVGNQKSEYERWDAIYRKKSENYSTCRYVETIGPTECRTDLQGLIELHDGLTKALSNAPLA